MARQGKTVEIFVVQGNYGYGHGWEDLTAADTYTEARGYLRDYRANEPGPHRLIRRRVLRDTMEPPARGRARRRAATAPVHHHLHRSR